jgi:MFS transporter, OFA family, oxalate/formate antiporter
MFKNRHVLRNIYYGWVIVLAVFFINVVVFGIQYSFGVFFTEFQLTFQWSRATTSMAMTIHLVMYALFMIPAIRATDHLNVRVIFSGAAILFGIAMVLCSRISYLWQLYLFYGLMLGSAISFFGPTLTTIVTRWFTERRGLALGIALAGMGTGTLVASPLSRYFVAEYGWRDTFTILGIACFVILIICAQLIKRSPPFSIDSTRHSDGKPSKYTKLNMFQTMTLAQVLKTKPIYLILIASTFFMFTVRSVMVHLAPHIIDVSSSAVIGALAVGVIGGSGTAGRIIMGLIQDKIGARSSMLIGIIALACSMFALPFIKLETGFFIFAVVFGFAYGGDVVQIPVIVANCYGSINVGTIYGFVGMIGTLIGAIGPYVTGFLYDLTGSYLIIFLLMGAALLIGAFCVSRLKTRYI